ncbi:response regulator [Cytophaga hutchinsonii]|jgi:CheY-like chemotaxis protein|uniref:Response regulator with Che-like receiver domain n=1 Tax=Cytophaga hutchinsonii (strain ATCC 33406 / DSM 1761 / CIP 103989 / NBRC 15051 / NCIMB 9469 / D465) TaxID=269798 RepID=A0A6N4SRX8_CYTH3|nr:response regulator [Cytophaga hutchinsonii]ABG59166.1 response regulator with Che-like receiver domain [Cytophaga hutchinsonii ATCC 33406]SFX35182.1 Response regulator receiver domain-containing protein [Cytophaga hutchinsonii ATCC 33406]
MCLSKNIYLADDDEDDRLFFRDALSEVCKEMRLTIAKDGVELMDILYLPPSPLPDVIFLDLNMPVKNGFECLEEIKKSELLKHLPIIIFSTTVQEEAVNKVYKEGANFYICKPDNFNHLKKALKKVLSIDWLKEVKQISKEQFIVSVA